jgi:predicted RNase H-like HicB family nuclease
MAITKLNKKKLKFNLTTIIEEAPEGGYIGYIEEIPGVNTQGETLDEVKDNLLDAFLMALEYHRDKAEKALHGKKKGIFREEFKLTTA